MKKLKNRKPVLLIFFLLGFLPAVFAQQVYHNSLSLQFGLLHYNARQHHFFEPANTNKLMSGSITYGHKLGRLTGIHFTGKFYNWEPNGISQIQTRAMQYLLVFHPGMISRSWRINRITPYAGAGIGFQRHTIKQEGSESDFQNLYLPIEAGLMFNLSSRWSLGVFAEYKFDFGSEAKKKVLNESKNPDLINAAGVSLAYHFGKRKRHLDFPLVRTTPQIPDKEKVSIVELLPGKHAVEEDEEFFIRFKLQDMESKPVAGATISLDTLSGISDDSGVYTFSYLTPGEYSYTVTSTVHRALSGIVELAARNLELKITLEPNTDVLALEPSPVPKHEIDDEIIKEPLIFDEPLDEPEPVLAETPVRDTIFVETKLTEKAAAISDTLKTEFVFKPTFINPEIDTIRLAVVFDFSAAEMPVFTIQPELAQQQLADDRQKRRYEQQIDSLERFTVRLNNRINRMESIAARQATEVETPAEQPERATRRSRHSQPEPRPDYEVAALLAQINTEAELAELKQVFELLRNQIQQMAADNQRAMAGLKEQLTATQTARQETVVWRQPSVIHEPRLRLPDEDPAMFRSGIRMLSPDPDSAYVEMIKAELDSLNLKQQLLFGQLNQLQQQNRQLLAEVTALSKPAKEAEEEIIIPVSMEYTIVFGINSSVVSDNHLPKLSEVASELKEDPQKVVCLSGFADAIGDPAYNMILSQRRVQSVREVLMKLGVEQKQIVEQYFGSEKASGGINPGERKVELKIF
ncbi:MAG TPA: hypothetical protein ENN08_01590 [Bacteroidales bacterium]|nr:hypothetical protein [Bacteroidales bacterium]